MAIIRWRWTRPQNLEACRAHPAQPYTDDVAVIECDVKRPQCSGCLIEMLRVTPISRPKCPANASPGFGPALPDTVSHIQRQIPDLSVSSIIFFIAILLLAIQF